MRLRLCAFFGLFLLVSACASTPEEASPAASAKLVKPAKPAQPVYVLADILGAGAGAVDQMLGEPALTRKEGAGEYRRYALTTCTLILILYPDDMGVSKVAHVDATATHSGGDKPDLEDCLAAG